MKLKTLGFILTGSLFFCLQALGQAPYAKAKEIVEKIVKNSDNPNLKLLVKPDSTRTRNAKADIDNNKIHWILYNPKYVSDFERNAGTIFASYALFAHEVGHHVLVGQFFSERDTNRLKELELAADEFAGRMLKYPFCATYDEAMAGFRNMGQDKKGGYYPPKGAREMAVSRGWIDHDALLKANGQDPCEKITFPLKVVEDLEFQKYNLRTNPKATINGNVVEIEFEIPEEPKITNYKVFLLKLPSAPYRPQTLLWGNQDKPGLSRLVWEYKKDGFTLDQIKNKSDWYGIGVYDPKFAPEPFPKKTLSACIACDGLATGLVSAGIYLQIKAWSNYKYYKTHTNPDTYLPPGSQSRAELLQKARLQKNVSFAMLASGLISGFLCTKTIAIRSKKDKRYKALEFISK